MRRNPIRKLTQAATLLAGMSALVAVPLSAQETAEDTPVEAPAEGSPAALKAAAEAIDPLGQAAEAVAAWELYLKAVEASDGPVTEQALALNKMGDSRYYSQDFPGALEASLEAKRRLEEAGETDGEAMASSLANVATFYDANEQPEKVIPLQEQSLAIRQRIYGESPQGLEPEDAKALGLGYLNYASALYSRGRFTEAATYIDPAIDGLVIGGLEDATLFLSMTSGANILIDAGRSSDALAMAQRGTQLANELLPPRHPFTGIAQASLARILRDTDRFEEAEEPARNALDILNEGIGPTHPYTLTALHNLGVILANLGRFEEAAELTTSRYELTREGDPGESVISIVTASNALWESGDAERALELARVGGELAAGLPVENEKALRGLDTLSLRLEEQGDYAGALELLDRPRMTGRMQDVGDAVDAPRMIRRGLLNIRLGNASAGWPMVEQATAVLTDAMLDQAERLELGADLSSYYEPLMQIAEAAIAAGKPEAALQAFELASWGVNARARQFLAFSADRSDNPELAARIDQLRTDRERLRVLHREWTSLLASGNAELAKERKAAIDTLTPQVEALGAALEEDVPDFARWLHPATPDVAEMTARLEADQAILIAMPARHRTLTMALAADGVTMAETQGGRPVIRPLVAQLRSSLDGDAQGAGDFPFDAAKALNDQILPPQLAAALAGKTRVSVITSDALSRIPFAILLPELPGGTVMDVKDADWLAKSHAFSTALTPSEAFDGGPGNAVGAGFLGVGAPALAGDSGAAVAGASLYRGVSVSLDDVRALPALPATQSEVTNVAAAFDAKERTILTGAEATEARVRSLGEDRRSVALFATHGLLAGEIGGLREPALVLTPPQQATGAHDDGLLQASEIARLGLAADLVILSACNSAAGRNATAPAYTGLANAFLTSGTQSLMLSHWRVRDDAAARLTVDTLGAARGGTDLAIALQQAQLALMADTGVAGAAHPSVWAPFVLIGE